MNERLNDLTGQIIGAAVDVHRALGPGLLESAYEGCVAHEFVKRGISFERQKPLPVMYGSVQIDCAYRMDFVVNDEVIVEVKSCERLTAVHEAQLLTYLRLYDRRIGLLFNFNVKWLVDQGLKRFVNNLPE
ncbi:MAG TPA: GxxExxY protein [Vicinamibacterales bacterium]|nr:GxxExxY protein [Vicinamibacterales bacterium]